MPTARNAQGQSGKAGGSKSNSAGSKPGSVDPMEENDWLREMATSLAWMYEHCSRYGLDEALQGLVQSAERKFLVDHDELMQSADKTAQLRRWIEAGKLQEALEEVEFISPDSLSRSKDSIYVQTVNGLKTQMALEVLRSNPKDIKEFKDQVNAMFPVKSKNPVDQAGEGLRKELTNTKSKQDVIELLEKYSKDSFQEVIAKYFEELKKTQPPTMLEVVIKDIKSGAYTPSVSSAQQGPDEAQIQGLIGSASQIQQTQKTQEYDQQPQTQQPTDEVQAAPQSQGTPPQPSQKRKAPAHREDQQQVQQQPQKSQASAEPLVLTAWELRNALRFVGLSNDESDFSAIHQQTHPDVIDFLKKTGRREATPGASEPPSQDVSPAKPAAGKRKREVIPEESDDQSSPAKSDRSPIKQPKAVSSAQVHQLRDNSRKLQDMVEDPLQDAVRMARTAGKAAGSGSSRRQMFDSVESGKQVEWDSDEENQKAKSIKLNSPTSGDPYKPRGQLQQLHDNKPASSKPASGSKRVRWTKEEEEELIKGVQHCGEGNWRLILEFLHGKINVSRGQVELKDKWRNMKKYGNVVPVATTGK